jgi:proteic killer suppression protein
MIGSFAHKGLRQLFEEDSARGVNAEHVRKIKQILAVLHAADTIEALRLPTFRLHELKGDLKGFGQLPFVPTGGLYFVLTPVRLSTLIWSIIIEGGQHGYEEPAAPRTVDRG